MIEINRWLYLGEDYSMNPVVSDLYNGEDYKFHLE